MTDFRQRQAISTLTAPAARGLTPHYLVQPGTRHALYQATGTYIELLKQQVKCGILVERRHNLQLFDFMKWGNLFHITTVGNFLMLMPLSFYCPILFKKRDWGFLRMILIGFFISLSIELIQLSYDFVTGYAYRGFNVDDLMMNTLGVIFGFLVFTIVRGFFLITIKFIQFFYRKAR